VGTRLQKLSEQTGLDGTILAAAGLARLKIRLTSKTGLLAGEGVPEGLRASILELDEMLPCVGQAALGLEIREADDRVAVICRELNDEATFQCVTAERALLRALGGGCQTPVGAYAASVGTEIHLRAVSFLPGAVRRAEGRAAMNEATSLGERVAAELR
jgi:hydroxymethylbilane synthase